MYIQRSAAIFNDFSTTFFAEKLVVSRRAIAADWANPPPDPIAITDQSGSITFPSPETINEFVLSIKARRASKFLKI